MDILNSIYEYRHPEKVELLRIFPEAFDYFREKAIEILSERYKKEPTILEIKKELAEAKKEYKLFEQAAERLVDSIIESVSFYDFSEIENKEYERRKWIYLMTKKFYFRPLERKKREIKRLEKIIRDDEWKKIPETQRGEIGPEQIAQAKEYPLENLISVNRTGFAKCIWHNEKCPSLKIYKNQNRFHCFSCNADGDVIDFLMRRDKIDFLTAIRFLST